MLFAAWRLRSQVPWLRQSRNGNAAIRTPAPAASVPTSKSSAASSGCFPTTLQTRCLRATSLGEVRRSHPGETVSVDRGPGEQVLLGGALPPETSRATATTGLIRAATWCGGVTALDVFDVVTILDFGGDRTLALRELAHRFNLIKAAEKKVVVSVIFRLIRQQATQQEITAAAFAEGERQGLSRDEVCNVALWACQEVTRRAA